MANLTETTAYTAGIYQLEVADPVAGGVDGISNLPLRQLANRTNYLKDAIDKIVSGTSKPTWIAPLAGPTFTGDPKAPTAAADDNDTSLSTTAFVQRSIGGVTAKATTGGTVVLTAAEACVGILSIAGALTAAAVIQVPDSLSRAWVVKNATTGAFPVTIKTATGTGVEVLQGCSTEVYSDGTNVIDATASVLATFNRAYSRMRTSADSSILGLTQQAGSRVLEVLALGAAAASLYGIPAGQVGINTPSTVDGFYLGTNDATRAHVRGDGKLRWGTNTDTGSAGLVNVGGANGTALALYGLASGNTMMGFYPRGQAAGRKAYFGFATANGSSLTLANEDSGSLIMSAGSALMTLANSGELAFGTSNVYSTAITGAAPRVRIAGAPSTNAVVLVRGANDGVSGGGIITLQKTRAASPDSLVETQNSDIFGAIAGEGVNSSAAIAAAASVQFVQDGAAGAAYVPGRISFFTSDGTASWVERMRLDSGGNLGLGTLTPDRRLVISGDLGFSYSNGTSANGMRRSGVKTQYFNGITSTPADVIHEFTGSNDAVKAVITEAGNVGIGVSAPGIYRLYVNGGTNGVMASAAAATGATCYALDVYGNSSATASVRLRFGTAANAFDTHSYIEAKTLTSTSSDLRLGTSGVEAARIDGNGILLLGKIDLSTTAAGGTMYLGRSNYVALTGTAAAFYNASASGAQVGSISISTTATTYATSSDYRLKDVEGPLEGAGDVIDALQPKQGRWKQDGSRFVGFIAHEFQRLFPASVIGEMDAEDEAGRPIYQSMQASSAEVMAYVVAELQSIRKRLAAYDRMWN